MLNDKIILFDISKDLLYGLSTIRLMHVFINSIIGIDDCLRDEQMIRISC